MNPTASVKNLKAIAQKLIRILCIKLESILNVVLREREREREFNGIISLDV